MKATVLVVVLLLNAIDVVAQHSDVVLRGLAVYAGENEQSFPVLVRDKTDENGKPVGRFGQLTIQFDVLANNPPDLKIRFYHCNRDWKIDNNLFVNDNNHNTSFILEYKTSPGGVQGYSYRYINKFPDTDGAVRFEYSGNWIFRIMDKHEATVYAEGRFFVADKITPPTVSVTNDYLTANASPHNQIQKVVARAKLPQEIDGYYYTTVDVYQNKRIYQPHRIDMWDKDAYTFVEGQGTGERVFKISNIMPGNEYRVFDFSNPNRYPNKQLVKNVNGADQMRLFWRTGADHNGAAILNKFGGVNSDYLEVLFRLDMSASDYRSLTAGGREIFLVGDYNFWNPSQNDKLERDENERSYVVKKLLRRGIYDYQYITGVWDAATQTVTKQDWLAVEGNDWRTTNKYTVLVYFNDSRFGGFDRIVGIGRGNSVQTLPGSN